MTALLLALSLLPFAAPQEAYKHYRNQRFGYSICYPEKVFQPQGEADNGDGQKFLAKDGAVLLVYGMNNALDQNIREAFQEEIEPYKATSGKVTYKVLRGNWFVVSGVRSGRIRYRKTFLTNGEFKTFEIEYAKTSRAIYDPIVTAIARCFKP